MSSRGPRSAYSSRDASPETHPDRYDPFRSESDPIELAHLSRPDLGARDSYGPSSRSPSRSPDETSRGRLRPDSYFGLSRSSGQYAPLPGRNESPRPSVRSGRESMYTLNSLYQSKAVDADTQALVDRRAGEVAQWHVHWTTPALIASLFTAGVAAAIGHHFFYTHLNGQPATEQLKMVRYGTALAFFVKSTLVGSVIMCNRQRIWTTFRQKAMTITGIDGLFSATEDPTQFFLNWEMIRNGKLATLMAACTWLIPIASVLSPAALTSEISTDISPSTCPAVATLNFTRESFFNFRDENEHDGRGISLNYYNTTDREGTEGYFDYYDQPSKNARRLAFSSAYLKKPQPRENARLSFCGDGWNCTYSINFLGPGYKCEDMIGSDIPSAPFKISQLAPEGNFTYLAEVDQDDYKWPQIDTLDGIPIQDPPYPVSLGVFESEPVLWIGYANKTSKFYPDDSPHAKKWKYVHEPKMFKCVMHHTNYSFEMRYRPSQSAVLKQRDFLHPVIDTSLQSNPGNSSDWVATPSSNFIRPKDDTATYKLTAAYHSMGALLRTFLRGDIEKTSDVFIITRSDISETRLINGRTSYPQANLMDDVQNLFEDMLITLLSEPTLVLAEMEEVPCEKSRTIVVYRYYRHSLWIGYAVVISITLAFILVGARSIHQNGVASDVLFSRIMVTTRNPTLDHLSVGACLGGDPFPKELTETKLRFGVLLENDPREGPLGKVEHCCFGTVGETKEVIKGGTYAGLRTWRRSNGETADSQGGKDPLLEKTSQC
ncbi:Nn.00g114670.m01.CDS01 [Neocucurbitaria sp. VM-36]